MFGMGSKVDTVIGQGAEFKGNLTIKGSVYIYGRVEGNIKADERVTMGVNGLVKGHVMARNVEIAGKVQGNVQATYRVELMPTCSITGDVKTPRLVISDGAVFEGSYEMEHVEDSRAVEVKFGTPKVK